jgi:hypothetical protein
MYHLNISPVFQTCAGKLEKNSKRSELEARTAKEKDSLIQSQEEVCVFPFPFFQAIICEHIHPGDNLRAHSVNLDCAIVVSFLCVIVSLIDCACEETWCFLSGDPVSLRISHTARVCGFSEQRQDMRSYGCICRTHFPSLDCTPAIPYIYTYTCACIHVSFAYTHSVTHLNPLDYAQENKRLLEEITRLRSKIVTSSSARNVI